MRSNHPSIRRARPLLGTFVEIAVPGAMLDAAEAAVEAAFSAVGTVHRLMSFHETESDVSRLNREAASGVVSVHDWTYQVLEAAGDLYRRSGGVFDISIATALQRLGLLPDVPALASPSPRFSPSPRLRGEGRSEGASPHVRTCGRGTGAAEREGRARWPFNDAEPAGTPPRPDALLASGEREKSDRIKLLPGNRVRFADPSVKIDLGGIAKGFAVDRAVEALRRHGIAEGLVNAGGDLSVFGPRSHVIDIRDPRQPDRPLGRVALRNGALASSAGRFDPARSSHVLDSAVIDPLTAVPARSIIGATVCAPCCVIADALTKVVMNTAEAAGPTLEHCGADALFVSAHGEVHVTADWKNEVHLAA